jgi:probable O-glycosylation ligase (exosortase A-associated)
MPQQWFDRMETIKTYEQDGSAMGRINAWRMAFDMAKDRPLGGGFDAFNEEMFVRYTGSGENVHDSHSIYFEVLGEHGFFGLALFLLLGFLTWRTASKVVKRTRGDPQNRWLADLASMIQVSLVGYASGGAFLGLAYFDFYYTLVAVVVVCSRLLVPQEQAREPGLIGGGVLQGESTGGRVTT